MEIAGRKKFRGKTMPEAMIAMKRELGHDALLISHHKIRCGGLFGIGAKEYVEVVGERLPGWIGRNRDDDRRAPASRRRVARDRSRDDMSRSSRSWTSAAPARPPVGAFDDDLIVKTPFAPYNPYGASAARPKSAPPAPSADEVKAATEMAELKAQIRDLQSAIRTLASPPLASPRAEAPVAPEPSTEPELALAPAAPLIVDEPADGFSGVLEIIHARLKESGVPDALAYDIVDRVARRTEADELDDLPIIRARVAKEIASRLAIAPPLDPNPDVPLIIVCVGATGVGKTTTLAKLGALYADEEARSIAFITLDRYRIAAAEQLRTYSDILDVPFEEAATAEELSDAVGRHIDKEIILIDTAGRSPYQSEALQELKGILAHLRIDTELLLLVSATTDAREIRTVVDAFTLSERVRIVFTKVDEVSRWGSIFAAAVESKLPVAFWTTGQSVPDDIEPAEAAKFAEELLGPREAA